MLLSKYGVGLNLSIFLDQFLVYGKYYIFAVGFIIIIIITILWQY